MIHEENEPYAVPPLRGVACALTKELTDFINRKFKRRNGQEVSITATAIDLGGHFADEVRAFAGRFPGRRCVWAVKGRNNAKGTRTALVWPKKASKSTKGGALFYTIDSQLAKDAVFRLLQMKGDSQPTFPASMPADYLDKLMCEERKKLPTGYYWQPKKGGRAEEEWACLVYAYAALKGLQATWRKDFGDLNLAGERAGIPTISFDPETGELDYDGEDMSAHAVEKRAMTKQLDSAVTSPKTLADGPTSKRKTSQPEPSDGTTEVGEKKRKRKAGWSSGGSRFARRW